MAELRDADPFARFILRGAVAAGPSRLQTAATAGGTVLWLGPDEFLALMEENASPPAADAVVDVSHRQIALRLAGEGAALLLAGGVPLDLSEAAFPSGMVARTIFEKAEIVLWRRASADWHVEVARSFAPYLCDLLAAIAAANGIPLTTSSRSRALSPNSPNPSPPAPP